MVAALAPVVALAGSLVLAVSGDPRSVVVPVTLAWGLFVLSFQGRPGRIVAWAVAIRVPLLLTAPTLSDDVFRYVWEGRVWLAGENPFVLAPDDPALAPLRDETWASVNHRHVPSVYPPLAQALFVVLQGGGVLAWKVLSASCDVATAWLLGRRDPRAGWLWALLPLPAIESAVSGHLEGIGVLLVVVALSFPARRGLAAWAGAMIKLLPGVLLALEPSRRWIGWAVLTVAVCVPVVRPEGFGIYRDTWAYNASFFAAAEALLGTSARAWMQVAGAGLVVGILLRSRDPGRVALWTFGAFVLLSPTVHPWYVLWPLAAALHLGVRAWTVLAVTMPAAYVVLATYDPAASTWTEPTWVRWGIYPPFFVALAHETWARATRAGRAAVH